MKLEKALASAATTLLVSSFAHAADTYKIDPAHTSITFSVAWSFIGLGRRSNGRAWRMVN
jgi:polyisoprenoid-binding protein YceI